MDDLTRRDFTARLAVGAGALLLPGCASGSPARSAAATVRTAAAAATKPGLAALAHDVRGPVLRRGAHGYAAAHLLYNQRYDGVLPRAVVQPLDTRDVQAIVRWSAASGVRLAVRSGGHSYAGYSTAGGGVMVDLRRLRKISVNAGAATATAGSATQLIDLYSALAAHGLTVPAGSCPSVGLGGHALGGGMGLAGRRFGLTLDNVRALHVVTADGRSRRVDAAHDPDLFWALRGAGPSFGIVTAFELGAHAPGQASWFSVSWPWAQASAALDAWQRFAPHAPDALTSIFTLSSGREVRAIGQYFGTPSALRSLLAPLTHVAGASLSVGQDPSYLALQRRWAGCLHQSLASCHTTPRGTLERARFVAASHYVERNLSAAGRHAFVHAIEQAPSSGSAALLLDAYGGAINRVGAGASAFVHRDQLFCVQELAYSSAAGAGASERWLAHTHSALAPYSSGEAYQNYTDPKLGAWRSAYYGSAYKRLTEVKRRYDPDNLFRFAQSIHAAKA